MSLESPEAMVISISKDVERLTHAIAETTVLFRENQTAMNTLIAELREHKAVDDMIHSDVRVIEQHIYGVNGKPGLATKVHDLDNKVGNIWKTLWTGIGAVVTTAIGYFFAQLR